MREEIGSQGLTWLPKSIDEGIKDWHDYVNAIRMNAVNSNDKRKQSHDNEINEAGAP